MHTYIHTYIRKLHTCTYVHTDTHTYVTTHTYMYTHVHTYIVHTYIHTYAHPHSTCVRTCVSNHHAHIAVWFRSRPYSRRRGTSWLAHQLLSSQPHLLHSLPCVLSGLVHCELVQHLLHHGVLHLALLQCLAFYQSPQGLQLILVQGVVLQTQQTASISSFNVCMPVSLNATYDSPVVLYKL